MSLYYESSHFLESSGTSGGSLRTLVYSATGLKSKPAQIYALLAEAVKWSSTLSEIVDRAGLLKLERKLTPALALLLVHDLLLSRHGVAAPKEHVLRLAVERHKARLSAEFTKSRVKAGFSTVDMWKSAMQLNSSDEASDQAGSGPKFKHPRWIRLNTLKSFDAHLSQTFAGFKIAQSLDQVLIAPLDAKIIARDEHIPNLVAVPSGCDFSKSPAYLNGSIIFQDKASCFPALLLDPQPSDGDIIDACAAPGNKTTHLVALLSQSLAHANQSKPEPTVVYACERDRVRAQTLAKMIHTAGVNRQLNIKAQCLSRQNFLRLDPNDPRFRRVGAILLDPSCSGSGIIDRDIDDAAGIMYKLTLPRAVAEQSQATVPRSKKRKLGQSAPQGETGCLPESTTSTTEAAEENPKEVDTDDGRMLSGRLAALAGFQVSLLAHAFRFPAARKVVYSTCSVHAEENEQVVARALSSATAMARGWRIATRAEQVDRLKTWPVRGDAVALTAWVKANPGAVVERDARDIADACLRCEKATEQGTMGFFTAMFVRDELGSGVGNCGGTIRRGQHEGAPKNGGKMPRSEEESDEWRGLSDDVDD